MSYVCPECASFSPANFKLKRALIVSKLSRYEFEQMRHPDLSREQLEQKLRDRGTDVENMLYLHNLHKDFERRIVRSFRNVGCEVKLSSRWVDEMFCGTSYSTVHLSIYILYILIVCGLVVIVLDVCSIN